MISRLLVSPSEARTATSWRCKSSMYWGMAACVSSASAVGVGMRAGFPVDPAAPSAVGVGSPVRSSVDPAARASGRAASAEAKKKPRSPLMIIPVSCGFFRTYISSYNLLMAGLGGKPNQAANRRKGPMRRPLICSSTDRRPPAEHKLNLRSFSTSTVAGVPKRRPVFGTGSEATMAVGVGSTSDAPLD